jgi:predicted permease
MSALVHEVRLAVRALRRAPGFSLIVIATLAIGIGANTAIFSVVNAVLLRPFAFEDPDRLVVIWESRASAGENVMFASPPNYADWRTRTGSFESMAAFAPRSYNVADDIDTQRVQGAQVSASLFPTLGVTPALGRVFTERDDQPGAPAVVILSWGLWQSRYGADPAIVGRSIRIADAPHEIIGVMPLEFDFPPPIDLEGRTFPRRNELWTPLAMDLQALPRSAHFLTVIARLAAGVSAQAASAEMASVAARLEGEFPETNGEWTARVVPFDRVVVGDLRTALLILLGAVSVVLLIACANLANVMLARASDRQREYAIRAALGAGRVRLVRQSILESQVLALVGGLAGLALAFALTGLLIRLAPAGVPRLAQTRIDVIVALYAFGVSVVTGALFGLAPATRAFSADLAKLLKQGQRATSARRPGLRGALVIAEVAMALILLAGAGLLFRSFIALRGVETGVTAQNVLTMRMSAPESRYADAASLAEVYRSLEERIGALPGVEAAGFTLDVPLASDHQGTRLDIEGEPPPTAEDPRSVHFSVASPGYFRAMGVPVTAGRGFDSRDGADAELVVLINDALAQRFFPGQDPVGRRIILGGPRRIIGVIGNVRLETMAADPGPAMILPHAQIPERSLSLVVRTRGEPVSMIGPVRDAIRSVDRGIPLYDVKTMEQVLADSVAQPRFSSLLLLVFSAIALALATVGIYGVISYTVTQRSREIGLRIALGARAVDVVRMVIGNGLALVATGMLIGIGLGLVLSRTMASMLHGTAPGDPFTFVAVSAFLLLVSILACWIPAHRASRLDPLRALRLD